MIYKPFDVILVPFPFTDKTTLKKRPALVLSNSKYQIDTNHLVLAMITSAKNSSWVNDYKIDDIASAGLNTQCVVRAKLFSLDERLIIKKIGSVSSNEHETIISNFKAILF